jgi:adenine-specific DNA-methyltransferase
MVKYTCEKCGREFQQKGHFTRHNTKVNPCIQESKLNEIIDEKVKNALSQNDLEHKKKMGQYFTISDDLQKFVFDKVKHKGSLILEPSFGAGHLLKKFKDANTDYPIVCYELDNTIKPTIVFNNHQTIVYGDFTKQIITQKFKTIIGNPPYVKQSTGNLYIKFIEICFGLLEDDGEIIFIVPSDFIKLTSASSLIDSMIKEGSFTDFLFPHDEKLFEGASVDVVVFRYEKGVKTKDTIVNGKNMICNVNSGIITFSETEINGNPLSDKFNVYVGLVSGRDEVYRNDIGNMNILNDKDRVQKYIFAERFPTGNTSIDAHLRANKSVLLERKIRKFNEDNWFEWGAPRNITTIQKSLGKPCIFVRNMTRNQEVAFIDKVQNFGGSLLCLIPKEDMTEVELKKIVSFLNTKDLQKDYLYSGRFKIGHKQVCNIIVPT